MKYILNTTIFFLIIFSFSCASYKYKQLQSSNTNKVIWKYPTLAYSYIKAKMPKEDRNKIDSCFYAAIKEDLSIIPQDSFFLLTNELRNNDSASASIKNILKKLKGYGVNFILFPEYHNFFNRTIKGKGGFKITIGKGYISKPTRIKVVDSTSFFLAITLVHLDSEGNLNTKIINSQLPTTYRGRRNKYLPGEPDSFHAFELEAINIMAIEIREKIKYYIDEIGIKENMEM